MTVKTVKTVNINTDACVLSIDLASRQTGWAVINKATGAVTSYGVIAPPSKLNADQRLPYIEEKLEEVLNKYQIKLAILEQPAGGAEDKYSGPEKNWLTMSVLFITHGVVRNLLQKRGIKYEIISPSTWQNRLGFHKRDRDGRKAAAKEYAVKEYNLLDTLDQDIYDAICLYACNEYLTNWRKDNPDFDKNKNKNKKNNKEVSAF